MNGLTLLNSGEVWKPLTAKAKTSLFERLNENFTELPALEAEQCTADQISLTFYPKAKLVFVNDPAWMESWEGYYFVVSGKKVYRLDGDSNIIRSISKDLGLELTSENVGDYLVFFSTFILGDMGTFPILANSTKNGSFISPKVTKKTKAVFTLEAHALYNNFVFKCSYEVTVDGNVQMLDDVPVAALESANSFNPHYRLPSPEQQQIH